MVLQCVHYTNLVFTLTLKWNAISKRQKRLRVANYLSGSAIRFAQTSNGCKGLLFAHTKLNNKLILEDNYRWSCFCILSNFSWQLALSKNIFNNFQPSEQKETHLDLLILSQWAAISKPMHQNSVTSGITDLLPSITEKLYFFDVYFEEDRTLTETAVTNYSFLVNSVLDDFLEFEQLPTQDFLDTVFFWPLRTLHTEYSCHAQIGYC